MSLSAMVDVAKTPTLDSDAPGATNVLLFDPLGLPVRDRADRKAEHQHLFGDTQRRSAQPQPPEPTR